MAKSSIIADEFKAIQTSLEALEPLEEPQRKFAVTMILTRLGITPASLTLNLGGVAGGAGAASAGAGIQADIKSMTPRDFLKSKRPNTDLQRLTCLAFYLANARNTPAFKTRELTDLNTDAAGPKFSNAATTANNAVNQNGFLSHAGGGKKQITPLGEDVVNALPDQDAVARAVADAPKKRKYKTKGKSKRTSKSKANA